MSESNDAAAAPEAPAAAPKASKLPIILALVNFLAVLGLGGYFVYTQQHAAAQPKAKAENKEGEHGEAKAEHGEEKAAHGEEAEEEPAEEGHGEKAEEKAAGHGEKKGGHGEESKGGHEEAAAGGGGPLLVLDPMVTNMAEPDSDRYLKVGMQLRITSEAARAEVEAEMVPVRNQILLYLSSLTIADTSGAENKRDIQKRVKRIANEAMPSSRITQVYFTEFVIQ